MFINGNVVSIFSASLVALTAGVASSQNYPNKPIRIVTTFAGDGPDFMARLIGQGVSGSMGQPVIVENRPAGVIPSEVVSTALPDGYTILLTGSTHWILPLLQNTRYDPVRDFSPITLAEKSASILVLHPSLPVDSVKDLIVLAKANPGSFNYGSTGVGGTSHLAAELFKTMSGVDIVRVGYKGSVLAVNDLVAGQVHLMIANIGGVMPFVKSGKLKALAVSSAEPSALFPGLATVGASGLPGYDVASMTGLFVPAKTPAAIIDHLNKEIVRVLNSADVKGKFLNAGMEAFSSSPEEFAAKIKSEMAKWSMVIKVAGIKVD